MQGHQIPTKCFTASGHALKDPHLMNSTVSVTPTTSSAIVN